MLPEFCSRRVAKKGGIQPALAVFSKDRLQESVNRAPASCVFKSAQAAIIHDLCGLTTLILSECIRWGCFDEVEIGGLRAAQNPVANTAIDWLSWLRLIFRMFL